MGEEYERHFMAITSSLHFASNVDVWSLEGASVGWDSSSALATMEGFAITAENYAKAVEILKDRFGRKDAIINSHTQKIIECNSVKNVRMILKNFEPRQIQPTWLVHTGISEAEKGTLLEEEKESSVLGLIWKPDKDTLSVNWCGAITFQLVQARAKVASIKPITIPRLELLACTIGSRLINTTKIDLGLENVPIYCWSDSVNALLLDKAQRKLGGTFVEQQGTRNTSIDQPRRLETYSGILNPADLPSRGCV
ncbi:DUF1758 domain-containing protein [Trichonephila clavipes]|nr:DUF1758 domain-containing protein [Trichonephila clavipes]